MPSVEPTPERCKVFQSEVHTPGPVVMINLIRFRDTAEYPNDFEAEPCTEREAYKRYSALAFRQIQSVDGRIVFLGQVQATVIAPDGEEWDQAFLVEYPSRAVMLEVLARPEYRAIVPHRTAALLNSRLIAVDPAGSSSSEA
jgi:uncharacterized protein (DUF1330 family)